MQENVKHFLKWLNLKAFLKRIIKQISLIKKSHCLLYSQVMFKLSENVFEISGWVGAIFYDYPVENPISCMKLSSL